MVLPFCRWIRTGGDGSLGAVHNADRVLGLHFFSPVPTMGLVEIVRALDTSDEAIGQALTFVERLGKQAIETKDRSGFIVNFLLIPYLMAAVRISRTVSPAGRTSTLG
jgi:3-hydroxybutyryl-CoA dehydrogenase